MGDAKDVLKEHVVRDKDGKIGIEELQHESSEYVFERGAEDSVTDKRFTDVSVEDDDVASAVVDLSMANKGVQQPSPCDVGLNCPSRPFRQRQGVTASSAASKVSSPAPSGTKSRSTRSRSRSKAKSKHTGSTATRKHKKDVDVEDVLKSENDESDEEDDEDSDKDDEDINININMDIDIDININIITQMIIIHN